MSRNSQAWRDSRSPSRRKGHGVDQYASAARSEDPYRDRGGGRDHRGARRSSRSGSRHRRDGRQGDRNSREREGDYFDKAVPKLRDNSERVPAKAGTVLEIVVGVNDMTNRSELKSVMERFGHIAALYLPPVGRRLIRGAEQSYVKFANPAAAQACKEACDAGEVFSHERPLRVVWRTTHVKTSDAHDFDAKGSNLTSSRDLIIGMFKKEGRKVPKRRRSSSSSSSSTSRQKRKRLRRKGGDIFGGPGSQAAQPTSAPQAALAIKDTQNEELFQDLKELDKPHPVEAKQTDRAFEVFPGIPAPQRKSEPAPIPGIPAPQRKSEGTVEAIAEAKKSVEANLTQQLFEPQGCPKCGEYMAANSIFCRKCGDRREDACPGCGILFVPGSNFCRKCGTQREACLHCGSHFAPGAVFCRKCGQKRYIH